MDILLAYKQSHGSCNPDDASSKAKTAINMVVTLLSRNILLSVPDMLICVFFKSPYSSVIWSLMGRFEFRYNSTGSIGAMKDTL